jgi:hypothetical protein
VANFLVLADCRVGRLSVGGLSFGGLSFGELSYLLDCRVGGLSEYEEKVCIETQYFFFGLGAFQLI